MNKYLTLLILILIMTLGCSSKTQKEEIKKEELILETYQLTIKANEEAQIKAYVNNNSNASIQYMAVDTNIVSVSETGLVKGLKPGNSYVTVSYIDNNGETQKKNCFVTVTYNDTYVIENLSLPEGDLILKVGDTKKIEYEVTPPNDFYLVKYQSTNPSIASVDENGNLKGLRSGIIAIRVTVNNSHVDKLVHVTDEDYLTGYAILPSKIIFKNKAINIKLGDDAIIPYTYEPENANINSYSKWESSNPNVVSIEESKIKGLSIGTSDITLKTVNGIVISTKVTVKPIDIPATSINITSSSQIELNIGDTSTISYELLPSETTDTISFSSNNGSIATVSNKGQIKAIGEGTAIITLKAGTITKNVSVTVKKESSSPTNPPSGGTQGHCKISSDPVDEQYNSCFKWSHHLTVSTKSITLNVGESKSISVGLPKECGTFIKYTRTSADGSSGWNNYVSQSRTNINSSGFTWIVTGKKRGSTIVSQTVQYDAKSPSGKCSGNVKSMITVSVKVN